MHEQSFETLDMPLLRRHFHADGCVIVRGALEKESVQSVVDRWVGFFNAILELEHIQNSGLIDLDELHQAVENVVGDERARHFHTMGRDFPAFSSLISSRNLMTVVEGLFETSNIQTIADNNTFRIDKPHSTRTNLNWHQDYPYNMQAKGAATAWIPVRPVVGDMGRLKVVLGCETLYPITFDEIAKKEFHNSGYIAMSDLQELSKEFEQKCTIVPDMYPGDLLILHGLTVHKSGFNHSSHSRWVVTARFADFMDSELYARNWFTMRAKYPDIFKNYHPDLYQIRRNESE